LDEVGAVLRFIAASGWARHRDLQPFAATVDCAARVPLKLTGAQQWQRRPAQEFTLPLDGREPIELGDWPATFATPSSTTKDGFASRGVFHATFPRDTMLRVTIANVAELGGSLRVAVDGNLAAESSWKHGDSFPATLAFPVSAGAHTIALENTGASDWVQVAETDLGVTVPALAAIGRRNDRFLALWVRHRTNLLALQPEPPLSGTITLEDVPAGTWSVVWWDTVNGTPSPATTIEHAVGTLRLPTPPIVRHATVTLVRQP
jgi:hypothetical protein